MIESVVNILLLKIFSAHFSKKWVQSSKTLFIWKHTFHIWKCMQTLTFFFSKIIYLKLFKASEYPWKIKKLKTICCIYGVPIQLKWRKHVLLWPKYSFWKNLKLILCPYTFHRNLYIKNLKNCSSLSRRLAKKCKTCVTIRTFKMNTLELM